MNKKDIFEIKSRLKKNGCTFTKMSGCYVNSEKEKVLKFNETFLNLEEEEFYKYLDIAKKTFSGTLGNNLLELSFPLEEERPGGKQQFLMGLRESKLKNEELLDIFYQLIIDNYDYVGNYLILLYHDAYDVMTKTSDNRKLDESEEVYEYLLVAICPVELTKPGLGYFEDVNKIGPRKRDWVVLAPDSGFIFPAFTERSSDVHSTMFYTKNAIEPHKELMEFVLGCPVKNTATEQKNIFESIIKNSINDLEKSDQVFSEIQESLGQMADEQGTVEDSNEEPVILSHETVQEILIESGLPDEIMEKIENAYTENFSDEPPLIDYLIDKKILAENEKRKVQKALVEKVEELQGKLDEISKSTDTNFLDDNVDTYLEEDSDINTEIETMETYDIVLKVKPEKRNQIKSQMIDGKKYIMIPMEEDEAANVNGERIF